uniref:Uncharacterized protein n=1 Tax=Aegilops tauschii subsp. strangulata TaxID=200361 RepID=A0A453ALE9_AEGTS
RQEGGHNNTLPWTPSPQTWKQITSLLITELPRAPPYTRKVISELTSL